jgi:hypothetical protein
MRNRDNREKASDCNGLKVIEEWFIEYLLGWILEEVSNCKGWMGGEPKGKWYFYW